MDFEQIYKEESGFDVGKIHEIGTVYYSDDYVKWLEDKLINKLTIPVVVERSEWLPILDRCECEEPNEELIKVCMHCNGCIE